MGRKTRPQPTLEEQSKEGQEAAAYWAQLRQDVTSNALFLDAAAIIDCHDPKFREPVQEFLNREAVNYRYITSTYCVCEIVRRMAAGPNKFVGPGGERLVELSLYVLKSWLASNNVKVICVPAAVFELGRARFEQYRNVKGWSLTDAISYEIVRGLGKKEIVSGDHGFKAVGFMLLP